ncbi:hypothetical protein LOK49_LG09G01885 [Camellia lanceoleosa]|uniref:Uncharacterized protein n=1 Tax=Camellia lanceoleosa TaxID=1840588 RepID=A0ACC0GE55_9ERIC|nr:hypothetical protein LOK49_LG09G01885 [Camellia lanceoleosa]
MLRAPVQTKQQHSSFTLTLTHHPPSSNPSPSSPVNPSSPTANSTDDDHHRLSSLQHSSNRTHRFALFVSTLLENQRIESQNHFTKTIIRPCESAMDKQKQKQTVAEIGLDSEVIASELVKQTAAGKILMKTCWFWFYRILYALWFWFCMVLYAGSEFYRYAGSGSTGYANRFAQRPVLRFDLVLVLSPVLRWPDCMYAGFDLDTWFCRSV